MGVCVVIARRSWVVQCIVAFLRAVFNGDAKFGNPAARCGIVRVFVRWRLVYVK